MKRAHEVEQGGNVKRILIINNRNGGDINLISAKPSTVFAENGARCFACKRVSPHRSNTISVFSSCAARQKNGTCRDRSAMMRSVP